MTFKGKLICTDPDCDAIYDAIGNVGELEASACFCGGRLEVMGLPEDRRGQDHTGFVLLPLAALRG